MVEARLGMGFNIKFIHYKPSLVDITKLVNYYYSTTFYYDSYYKASRPKPNIYNCIQIFLSKL